MKKQMIICMAIAWMILFGTLFCRFAYNEALINACEHYNFNVNADVLLPGNLLQPYIAYYNRGNLAYQQGAYSKAVESYQKALEKRMPQEKECSVRINLALALLGEMGQDYAEPDNIALSLEKLYMAKDVLTEKGCADEQGTGHSDTAEILKNEIEEMIQILEAQQLAQKPDETEETGESSEETQKMEDSFEQDVKETMREKQAESAKERKESMDFREDINFEFDFNSDGVIW